MSSSLSLSFLQTDGTFRYSRYRKSDDIGRNDLVPVVPWVRFVDIRRDNNAVNMAYDICRPRHIYVFLDNEGMSHSLVRCNPDKSCIDFVLSAPPYLPMSVAMPPGKYERNDASWWVVVRATMASQDAFALTSLSMMVFLWCNWRLAVVLLMWWFYRWLYRWPVLEYQQRSSQDTSISVLLFEWGCDAS